MLSTAALALTLGGARAHQQVKDKAPPDSYSNKNTRQRGKDRYGWHVTQKFESDYYSSQVGIPQPSRPLVDKSWKGIRAPVTNNMIRKQAELRRSARVSLWESPHRYRDTLNGGWGMFLSPNAGDKSHKHKKMIHQSIRTPGGAGIPNAFKAKQLPLYSRASEGWWEYKK